MEEKIIQLKSFIDENTTLQNIYDYLEKDELPIHYRWPHLETLLFWTCNANNLVLTKILIEQGADINTENMYGCTPLYYAITACRQKYNTKITYENNLPLVEYLINKGANIFCTSVFSGYDLFYLASCLPEILKLLNDKKLLIQSVKNYKKIITNIEEERNKYEHFWRYKWESNNNLYKSRAGISGNLIVDELLLQKLNIVRDLENSLFL